MSDVLVVGSGATGAQFALSALRSGHQVTMLDVGFERPASPYPEATFDGLKAALADPVDYFIGEGGSSVVYPASHPKYYGFPPTKEYVFRLPGQFALTARGFDPLFSFARGGLAEAWTGGSYEYADDDLAEFPFGHEELRPYYGEVARRIGISAVEDDLVRFAPFTADYLEPLRLDPHSERLLGTYQTARERLQRRLGFFLGRSRVATLSRDLGSRQGCDHLGRCLWGCPRESIYAPSATLRDCQELPGFRYVPGRYVRHFEYAADGRVTAMVAECLDGGEEERFPADLFVLAAGTLCSTKVYLDSLFRQTGRVESLGGLMDNRMVMIPFLTLGLVGTEPRTAHYQFHLLAFGIEGQSPADHVHGQITTLKAAAIHPIVQSLPVDLRTGLGLFQSMRAGLGVANLWLPESRLESNRVTIRPLGGGRTELMVDYGEQPGEEQAVRRAIRTTKRGLLALGAVAPPGMTRILPKGASLHYAGTLPMRSGGHGHSLTPDGRSRVFPNLCVVDGSGFPFLPAKNHTFTLMANALRIADRVLGQ